MLPRNLATTRAEFVNATIKSGTNNYHGVVFEFLRNDALNANKVLGGHDERQSPLRGATGFSADGTALKPKFRYNQFGATFGGPIIRNKLFFFVDYQGPAASQYWLDRS